MKIFTIELKLLINIKKKCIETRHNMRKCAIICNVILDKANVMNICLTDSAITS